MQKIIFVLSLCFLISNYSLAVDLPLRKDYPSVATIEANELHKHIQENSAIVVDVRSDYEYQTLRILGAIHIPLGNIAFISRIKKLRMRTNKAIVFYCNGITCKKSYKASLSAIKKGITNTYAFDAGIATWARTYPTYTELLGKHLISKNKLISREKFAKHTLEPKAFKQQVHARNALVVDIREPALRTIKLFPKHTRNIPANRFDDVISYAKSNNSTLVIYDFVGKQTPWLQYKLEDLGVTDYYFLKGGAENYQRYMDQQTKP